MDDAGKEPLPDTDSAKPRPKPAGTRAAVDTVRRTRSQGVERLGDMLVRKGVIRRDQLEHALDVQRAAGGLLGRVLYELGMIDERKLAEALSENLGIELIDLNQLGTVEVDAARMIPETLARRSELVGVKFRESREGEKQARVVVAMADPGDFMALDSIRAMTGLEPIPAVAPRSQILEALASAYLDSPGSFEEAVGELKDFAIEATLDEGGDSDYIRLRNEAGLAPVVRFVNSMLFEAARMRASDIHIEPLEHDLRVRFRVDGELRVMAPPPKNLQSAIVSRIKIVSQLDIAERRLPQDGRLKIRFLGRNIDVRVSTMPTVYGEKVVLRLLDQSATELDLERLGFGERRVADMRRVIDSPHGIVLLCGPTGCGKSTTLYTFLSEVNKTGVNIVTVEDPVEYRIVGVNQTHVRPRIGLTFASVLRTLLRQDPDIMMVGEIRDLETLEVAVRSSLTGHLVFSTLHTNTAVSSVTRMVNMGLEPYLISATLNAALSQRLVRRLCPHCKEIAPATPAAQATLERFFSREIDFPVASKKGCEECGYSGYHGRLAISELMEPDDALREMISHNAPEAKLLAHARRQGMEFLLDDAFQKLKQGVTSVEEVLELGFSRSQDDAIKRIHSQRMKRVEAEPDPGESSNESGRRPRQTTIIDLDGDGLPDSGASYPGVV